MSYSALYAIPDAPPADGDSVASTTGWLHWTNAVLARADDHPELAHLAAHGWADRFEDLEHELEQLLHAPDGDPDLAAITAQVLAAVKARPPQAAALLVTDGDPAGDDDDTSESVEADPLAVLTEARALRKDGETWQVGSNWYTKRGGKIRKASDPAKKKPAGPLKKDVKAAAKATRADNAAKAKAAAVKLANGGAGLTHEDVVALDDHFATLGKDQLRGVVRAIGERLSGTKKDLAARLVARAKGLVAGQQPAAAPEPKPEPPPAHPAATRMIQALNAAPNLSDQQREEYGAAVARVARAMPKEALDRIARHVDATHFYASHTHIGAGLVDAVATQPGLTAEQSAARREKYSYLAGEPIGGAYMSFPGGGGVNSLHLDGAQDMRGREAGKYGRDKLAPAHEIYAHEAGHAVDGPAHEISDSAEWRAAYDAEIGQSDAERLKGLEPKLSWYGGTEPSEGLAEFSRLVYGSEVPHADIARDFPRATAVFTGRGLWPEAERTAPAKESVAAPSRAGPALADLFARRIPFAEVGPAAHADVLLDPLDPAAVADALAQLRAEGDDEAAAELLHMIGDTDALPDPPAEAAAEAVERPTPDELFAAALAIAEDGAARGEDTSDTIAELFSAVEPTREGFTGTVRDTLGREFHYQDGKRVKGPAGSSAPKVSRTQLKQQRREVATAAANQFLAQRKAGKPVTEHEARALALHLTHLTHKQLSELRQAHGATFSGTRVKKERIEALVKWAQNKSATRRRAQQGSALQQVVDYGGIDPNSADFKRFYGSLRDAVNDGVPLAAFKRGGMGLDALAQQMLSAGHIGPSESEDPSEHVVGLLRGRKMLRHAADDESQYADAYNAYLAGLGDDEHTRGKFDPNARIEWESIHSEHQGAPPFPGAVFDDSSHRWKNPRTGEEHPDDPNHPHQEHAAAAAIHDAQPGEERSKFAKARDAVTAKLSQTAGGRVVLAMGRGGAYLFHQIEHRLLYAAKKTQEVAVAAAKERGLDEDRTAKLKRALYLADFLGGYATGGAALAIAGPLAGKAAAVLPSASVAYLAYSTARDPGATWRAAKKVLAETFAGGAIAHESVTPDLAALLADRLKAAPDPEWYLALFHAALAYAAGDAQQALAAADAALRSQPHGPPE